MKMKKIFAGLIACLMLANTSVLALEHGAYKVNAETNYWNPDTGEIDDGGTANAALGEGMCRSATGSLALVEKDGDKYYVTIRLLLQSNTHSPEFWQRTGYNAYTKVSYQVVSENGVADSVDYRFQVNDPFAPIKASMYVVPMGRAVLWYIELDENSLSTNTGDFVVMVKAIEQEVDDVVVDEAGVEEKVEDKTSKTVQTEDKTDVKLEDKVTTTAKTETTEEKVDEKTEDKAEEIVETDDEVLEDELNDDELDEVSDVLNEVDLEETEELSEEANEEELENEQEELEDEEPLEESETNRTLFIAIFIIATVILAGYTGRTKWRGINSSPGKLMKSEEDNIDKLSS